MKRILTLMVMTLLIAAVPQEVFSMADDNSSNNYANRAPEKINIGDQNGYSYASTSRHLKNVIKSGNESFLIIVYAKKGMIPTVQFHYASYDDNMKFYPQQEKEITLSVYFTNGENLTGKAIFDKDHLTPDQVLNLAALGAKLFPSVIEISLSDLGSSNSPSSEYYDHIQYVTSLFKNYNINKIVIDNTHTIPINQNMWGTKYTFSALFKAVAEASGDYESFAPTTNNSSYSSSSTSSTNPSYSSSSSSTTSTYTTPSSRTYSTPSYNYSYKPEPKKRFWGFSAGYVQKQWQSKEGGSKEKMGFWEDSKVVHGVQAGFRATPYFKFGLGLNTGLLYEYYYTKSQPMVVDGYDVYGEMQEHALYMPVHLTYRLKFNDFHIYAFGGVGLDYGIMSKVQLKENGSDYVGYDNSPLYETEDAPDWKRFNASYEFGGGLRYKMVELQFTMSRGFLNMSRDSSYKLYQNKPMMFSLGFMF